VREGRRNEFSKFPEFRDPHKRESIPDPTAPRTFQSAKLDWEEVNTRDHSEWANFYRELIGLRHREIIPRLKGVGGHAASYEVLGPNAVAVHWKLADGAMLHLTLNASDRPIPQPKPIAGRALWSCNASADFIERWGVKWTIEDRSNEQRA
jgi:1,4-alpha-glucan branching enzyme